MEMIKLEAPSKQKVEDQIKAAEKKVAASGLTDAQANAINELYALKIHKCIDGDATEADREEIRNFLNDDSIQAAVSHAQAADEIEMLTRTLNTELVQLPLEGYKYLLMEADAPLLSPSGYHHSEGVFVKQDVMIVTNRLPASSNLVAYDLNKLFNQ